MSNYTSNGLLFRYTISNNTSYIMTTDDYTIIQDSFDKWDSLLQPNPRFTNGYTIEVSFNISTLEEGILGSAQVLTAYYFDTYTFGNSYTATARITMNSTYLNTLKNSIRTDGKSSFYHVMLHEIGHILGIGTYWNMSGSPVVSYLDGSETKYYYTGEHAVREYKSYIPEIQHTIVGLPIEDNGGSGTQNVHPEEGDEGTASSNNRYINGYFHPGLDNELMSGWMESYPDSTPLSRITLGFLEDMGFIINYNQADDYQIILNQNYVSSVYNMSNWLDLSGNANTFKSSYVQGFIDVNGGNIRTRNVTDHLMIAGDASLNRNLYVGGESNINNITIAKRLFVSDIEIGHGGNDLATNLTIGTNILENAVTTTHASDKNVAIGFNVLQDAAKASNDSARGNVAIGSNSMNLTSGGYDNVAIGRLSMGNTRSEFISSVAIGYGALLGASGNNSRVSHTVGIGYSAGQYIIGGYNTLIGSNTGARNSNTIEYSTAIGYAAKFDDSNQIMLGRSSEKVVIPGDASFNNHLFVNGVGTFSAPPVCSVAATSNNQLVNKSYVDTNSALLGADNTFTGTKTIFDNKVGIGIDNPQRNLTIYHADNPAIQLTNSSSGTGSTDGMAVEQYGLSSYITNKENGNIHFRTQGDTIRMTIQENGYIGIGTSSALAPIHVQGSSSAETNINGRYFTSGDDVTGFRNLGLYSVSDQISIRSNGTIYSAAAIAASDSRIKENMVEINDTTALDKLRQLKPTTYNYIDKIHRHDQQVEGFIAQEVQQVLPYAVTTIKDYIPNVFKMATYDNSDNSITIPDFDTSLLEIDSSGNIYTTLQVYDANDITTDVKIKNIISTDVLEIESKDVLPNEIFVYGQYVDNFCTIKKEHIFTVATAALQEVDRQLQAEKAKTASLETQVASLLERVAALES